MKKLINSLVFLIFFLSSAFAFFHYAEARETQIFYDDFESGIENWDLGSGWSVILEDGNRILQGTQHTFATAYLEGVANKLELRLKLLRRSLHLNIRSTPMPEGLNRYFIGLYKDGSYIKKQINNDFQSLKNNGKGISLNEWHKIKIEIINQRINVFSDNNLIIWAEDKNLLQEGGISFETFDNSIAQIDDLKVEMSVPEAKELKAEDLFFNGEHKGDITLSGREWLSLENGKFEQFGNIYLKDSSKLIIRNSTLKITRYQKLLNHWGIELFDNASLEIENSKLLPGQETLFVIHGYDRSQVRMRNSPTEIHLFGMFDKAKALVENSEIVGEIGGLISAYGQAEVKIIDSKIGAVNLHIPKDAVFEASGLGTGFFKDWNLQRDTKVSGINSNVILQNTELVKDRLGPGPYERSFPVFIDSSAKVKIKDSQLRKVVIELYDEKAEFSNFVVEKPTNFHYRDIHLENVTVMGQWGIFPHGSSDVVVRDSEEFWTFIYDDSKLTLINTHMDEFDPRDFRGKMVFENSRWDTAAEIIGGRGQGFVMGGMGGGNDFSMEGSVEIGYIGGFSWQDSKVTRIYEVVGKPDAKLILTKNGEAVWSGTADEGGKTSFSIKFDDNTFDDSWLIKDNFGNKKEVTFFSKTPIDMEESFISEFIREIKLKGPPSAFLKLLPPVIFIIFLLFILRKILRRKRNKQKGVEK